MRLIDAENIRIKPEFMHDVCGMAMIRVEDVVRILNEQPTIQPEAHWIPVTEKLPGIGEPVLDESLSVNWMSYKSGGKEWVFPRDVKAWIPLPCEPYKGVTE